MNRRFVFTILTLLALTLACGAEIPLTSVPAVDDLGTLVAATLTANAAPALPASGTTPMPVPEALRVVYARDGNLWLWTQGAGARQLTSGGSDANPRLSDDGQVIAFERANALWAIQSDGSAERLLVPVDYLSSFSIAENTASLAWFDFAPSSRLVYFNTFLTSTESGMGSPRLDLHRVDADSPAPVQLFAQGQGGDLYFSPDGQWLALSQPDRINISRPDGSQARTAFTFPLVSTYSEWYYLPEVVWMNTSTGFYVIIPASAILDNPADPARWHYVPLEGASAQLAAFITAPVWVAFPRLSPDGTRALYVRPQPSAGYELRLIDASTADALVASYPGNVFGLGDWSPDGGYFTFYQDDARNLYYAAPGVAAQLVSDVGYADDAAWVAGDTLLFKNGAELRLRRLGASSILIDTPVSDNQFDFAP